MGNSFVIFQVSPNVVVGHASCEGPWGLDDVCIESSLLTLPGQRLRDQSGALFSFIGSVPGTFLLIMLMNRGYVLKSILDCH